MKEAAPADRSQVSRPPGARQVIVEAAASAWPGFRAPEFVRELGGMIYLGLLGTRLAVRRPFDWGSEFVEQFRATLKVCFLPLILTAFALSFGPVGIQISGFFGLFGSLDRLGGVYEITIVRLFGPLVIGIVLAGAAGTAICADLGARVVREEIDALKVLGVEPVKSLVVPRVLVLVSLALLFNVVALGAGLLGLVLVTLQNGADIGPVFHTFFHNATTLELEASVLKCAVYGGIIAIVCCYKGLNVSGGPEGVGRAVNQSIVIAFLAIGFTDYVFTQLLLASHPILSEVRG